MHEVDGTMPMDRLVEAVLPLLNVAMPTRAPRGCVRMVLVGGPGSKANHLGAALVQRYGGNLISAVDVLHNASLTSTNARACLKDTPGKSQHINPLNQMEMLAPKELRDIMLTRLSQDDVRTGGFVLVGYPFNHRQITSRRAWYGSATPSPEPASRRRGRRMWLASDPYDGELYHVDRAMPTDEAVPLLIHKQQASSKKRGVGSRAAYHHC